MVAIYTDQISPRLEFVVRQIFSLFLKVPYSIIKAGSEKDGSSYSFTISYCIKPVEADLVLLPSGILAQNRIENIVPTYQGSNGENKLFVDSTNGFGFDLFSAVFWLLSRYEEYLPYEADAHGRFQANQCFAYKKGFLEKPVIDFWMLELERLMLEKCPGLISSRQFSIYNTIDVDNAFAYKGKGLLRQWGAFFKHLIKGEFSKIKDRSNVLRGNKPDPFDTYSYIFDQTKPKNIPSVFFHLGGQLDKFDRNLDLNSKAYSDLLLQLSQWADNGIHPSYASNSSFEKLHDEVRLLGEKLGKPIEKSRQHFLKLKFPDTYAGLEQLGIMEDYTMGFADRVGFRAGTSFPFEFYHLANEKASTLLVFPFCVMDGTLKDYMKLNPDEAKSKIQDLQQTLEQCKGRYIAIWHNETLSEINGWQGWRSVFESQFK